MGIVTFTSSVNVKNQAAYFSIMRIWIRFSVLFKNVFQLKYLIEPWLFL